MGAGPGLGRPIEDARLGLRKRDPDRVEELRRCRRRAGVRLAQGRKVVVGEVGLEDPGPHSGNRVETAGAAGGNGGEECAGVGCGDERDFASRLPAAQGDRPRRHVEHREHAHGRAGRRRHPTGEAAEEAGPVGEDDTLGPARAAAGEEHDVGVDLVELRLDDIAVARARRALEQLANGDYRDAERPGRLDARVIGHEQRGPGQLHYRRHLGRTEPCVHRRERGAKLGQTGEQRHGVERRVAPPRNAVAGADAVALQHVAETVRAAVEVGEGVDTTVERGRRPAGPRQSLPPEHIAHQKPVRAGWRHRSSEPHP